MNEVEKMYKSSDIEECNRLLKPCPFKYECDGCEHHWYPEFTAEKQIELIKWCLNNYRGEIFDTIETTEWFEEQLCAYINNEWQDLTEEERKQIRDILE